MSRRTPLIVRLRTAATRARRALSRRRMYDLYLAEPLHTCFEDPKCPSSWHGSGCWDIDAYAVRYIRATVCARDRKEAVEAYREYTRSRPLWVRDTDPEVLDIRPSSDWEPDGYGVGELADIVLSPDDSTQPEWSFDEPSCSIEAALAAFAA